MLVTTADVVANPTSSALCPHCNPFMHPIAEISMPKTVHFDTPTKKSPMETAFTVCTQ
jgi:hypothetical protein